MKYTEISFPAFGLTMNPGASFTIGPFTIHIYGLLIAAGLLLAVLYAYSRSKQFGLKDDDITDGVLCVTPFAILCARLYYCIFSWESGGYAANPISILYIWEGGLAIYGGVIGAVIGIIVFCKFRKVKLPALLDIVALGFLIGQALGRWGNFFNREAFGAETDFFLKMGLLNSYTGVVEFHHPTFLYESLWNITGFIALHFLSKKRQYDGQIALGYVAWYGLGRCIIEGLRTDSLYWGDIRVSQLLAAVSCFAAVAVLLWQWFKTHDPKNLLVNQIAAQKAAEEAAKAEESSEEKTEETAEEKVEEKTEEVAEEKTEEVAE